MRKTVLDTSQTQPIYKVDYAVPVTVDKTATVFEVIGNRKIVRAGTIVSSTKNLMGANQEKVLTDNTKGKGILIADIDITDGDAIGSSLALYNGLKQLGKNVDVVIPEYSNIYKFLPNADDIKSEGKVASYDLAIALDCGDIKRLNGFAMLSIEEENG